MIIGSAIAISAIRSYTVQGRVWNLFFRMAYIGYVLPMLVAVLVLLRLTWHWIRGKPLSED